MSASTAAKLYRWAFPHRQFYVRSRGSVAFYELSPATQILFASAIAALVLWVAYASVMVIFNED
ncbi:MAG TPA: hypothetical protein DCL48_16980, partial [Alphaproteobacteria bacterium]|nr:hypothetical protein [Alphaproteobacteria bacterium]